MSKRLYRLLWDTAYCTGITPWDYGEPPKELSILIEKGYIKPCRAVDIGCGTGNTVIYLSKMGFETIGIDISGEAIKRAFNKALKEGVKCKFIIGDITDPHLIDKYNLGKFDLAIDVGCLHTIITYNGRIQYVNNLNRLLRNGGKVLLWSFTRGFPGPPGLDPKDVENLIWDKYIIRLSMRFWWRIRWARLYILERIRS